MPRHQSSVFYNLLIAAAAVTVCVVSRAEDVATLNIDMSKQGPKIPATFFGLMTEEINHSYDGGLYAELIQNRTFQDPPSQGRGGEHVVPVHWFSVGSGKLAVDDCDPVNAALPLSVRLELGDGQCGIANDGYWGIPVRPNTTYTARFYAKGGEGFAGPVTAALRLNDGDVTVATATTQPLTDHWQKYTIQLKTAGDAPTTAKARFVLLAQGSGNVTFSYVSLFPPTYQDAPNGLRSDIMELLKALEPKFIRLPGGNYVEGNRFSDRFSWKEMIGPPDQRPGHMGCWSYRSSDGFGLPEYLLWCRQLGAEPVLALFAGYTLNGDHFKAGSPEMALYTKEAIEEIEYVSGPADSEWGKRRAADGFPEPFRLRYVEIGNEDWFDRSGSYDGRFTQIANAIRERYPKLKIIATAPVKSVKPDLYDDHFYRSPRQLRQMFSLYDKPSGPAKPLKFEGGGWNGRHLDGVQTFVGEWAAHDGKPTTNVNAALADAAFVMGLEKNSDAVPMQCYAPLFANVNLADTGKGYPRGWQWEHNLIGYDALGTYGSPSYHAQVMLAQNKGDVVLSTELDVPQGRPKNEVPRGSIGLGSWHTQAEYTDISVTGPDRGTLLAPESLSNRQLWTFVEEDWKIQGKAIRPGQTDNPTWAFIGDPRWTDYTVRLRARKLSGDEGFIVIWHAADNDNYYWWNIGGWGNTTTRAEAATDGVRQAYGPESPFNVEANRWYDLRLEVSGRRMRGYVDGKLITDATYESSPVSDEAYASATYSTADSSVIVKVVNAGATPLDANIHLAGAGEVDPHGTALVLTGDPGEVNTVDEPRRVAPKQDEITNASTSFRHSFPPRSFTIVRLRAASQ